MPSTRLFFIVGFCCCLSFIASAQDEIKILVQDGHAGEINAMMLSYNNKYLVTGSADQTAIIWDVRTGAQLHKIEGHRNPIRQAGFAKDDKYVISQDGDFGVIGDKPCRLIVTEVGTWKTALIIDSIRGNETLRVWEGFFALHNSSEEEWSIYSLKELKRVAKVSESKYEAYAKKLGYEERPGLLGLENKGRAITAKHASTPDSVTLDLGVDSCQAYYSRLTDGYYRGYDVTVDEKRLALMDRCNRVFINDVTTGELIRTLQFSLVDEVIFSNDGEYLLCALRGKIQMIRVSTGDVIMEFKSLVTPVVGMVPDPVNPGKIVIAQDSSIRTLDLRNPTDVTTFAVHGDMIRSLSLDPSGNYLASGGLDAKVNIWDFKTGEKLKTMNTRNSKFTVDDIFGSSDEYYYVEKLDFYKRNNDLLLVTMQNKVFVWSFNTGHFQRMPTQGGIFETDGNDVFVQKMSGDSVIVSSLAHAVYFTIPPPHIFRKKKTDIPESPYVGAVAVAARGKLIALGGKNVIAIWQYDSLGKRRKIQEIPGCTQFFRFLRFSDDAKRMLAYCKDNTLSIYERNGERFEKISEQVVSPLTSITFLKNGYSFLTCDQTGNVTRWSPEGKVEYSIYFFEGNNYFIVTSDGYYMSSKASYNGISFAIGDKVVPAQQFDVMYNRPDKVIERVNPSDTTIIAAFRKAYLKRLKRLGIDPTKQTSLQNLPVCEIANANNIALDQKSKEIPLKIVASDQRVRLKRLNVWVNGVPLFGADGKPISAYKVDTMVTVKLSQGRNKIEASVINDAGAESFRQPLLVTFSQPSKSVERVYFVGIGIDKFKDKSRNLRYSVKDIRDLARKLKNKYGDAITIDTLMNSNVSVGNIKELKTKLQSTSVDDKVIVAFSGHGILNKNFDYYLSTYDVNFSAPEKNGLPYQDLEGLLDGIPARRKLLLLDACHSGELDKDDLVAAKTVQQELGAKGVEPVITNEVTVGMKNSFELMQDLFVNVSKSTGTTVISAAAGTQFALERGDLRNGVFTFSILEALQQNQTLTVSSLKRIVGERVVELTKGLQRPTFRNETIDNDWKVW